MSDKFYEGLCESLQTTIHHAVAEVKRLRLENSDLKCMMASDPPTIWWQQERIAELELKLAALTPVRMTGAPCSDCTDSVRCDVDKLCAYAPR